MSSVSSSVDVDVDVSTAYNQWTQFESFPSFMDGVESISQQGPTRTHWGVKVAGAKREFDTEITDQEPDRLIAWRSTSGDTGGHTGRVMFEAVAPTSTRVNIELGWEPEGLVEKAGAALGFDQRQVDSSARDFKKFIESRGGQETGAWRGAVE
ncbi:MAG TPA: SRPBCC family protein [Microlunatus sp.]|nr:SRPBCC family protein [Microlunatus sp.]